MSATSSDAMDEPLELEEEPQVTAPVIVGHGSPNPNNLDVGDKVMIVGRSQSGKSTMIEQLVLSNHKKFNVIWAFCGTVGVSKCYTWNEPFLIDLGIATKLGEDSHFTQIKKIVRAQMTIALQCAETKQPCPAMLLIFDDCLDLDFARDDQWWGSWMSKLRHYNVAVIFSVQTLHRTLSTTIRSQPDTVYIYENQTDPDVLMKTVPGLYYGGRFCTGRQAFNIISNLLDEKYKCVFFDNKNRHFGHVFKCKLPSKFVISYGCRPKSVLRIVH